MILDHHAEDEVANLLGNSFPANYSASSRNRSPIKCESCSMPANNGFWADDDEGSLPARPQLTNNDPKGFVEQIQSRSGMLALENRELPPEHKVFQQQRLPSAKATKNGGQKQSD